MCKLQLSTTRGQEGLFNCSLKMPSCIFKLASGILTKRSIMAELLFDLPIIGILREGDLISPFKIKQGDLKRHKIFINVQWL